jgi:hypothetical protein
MEIGVDGSVLPFSKSVYPNALVGSTLDTFQWNGDSVIAVSESAVGMSTSNLKAYYRLLEGFAEPALDPAFITTANLAYSVVHGTLYTAYSEKPLVHTIQGAGVESSITGVKTFDFSDTGCGLVSGNATVGPPYGIQCPFVTPDQTSLFLALTSCASQSGMWFPLNTNGIVRFGLAEECAFHENSDPLEQCLEPVEGQDTAAMTAAFLYSIDPTSQQVIERCKPYDPYEDVTNVSSQRQRALLTTRSPCIPLPDKKDQCSIYVQLNDFCEFDQERRLCDTSCNYSPPSATTAPSALPTAAPSVACVNQFTAACAPYT